MTHDDEHTDAPQETPPEGASSRPDQPGTDRDRPSRVGHQARTGPRGGWFVEIVRLGIVIAFLAVGFALSPLLNELTAEANEDRAVLLSSSLGALIGYLAGGALGRGFLRGVDKAQERFQRIDAAVLIAAAIGAVVAALFGMALLWPVLLLPWWQTVTIPVAMVVLLSLIYAGGRLGAARGGDLLRFVGARGRLEVSSPSRGGGVKLVDTSALMDGRLVDVARAGFLEGTLVVPRFVLEEMQSMADVEDNRRRNAARRGMDSLRDLQEEHLVPIEVTDEDVRGVVEVDAKLAQLCRQRNATMLTVDANLARVAEISGVRVMNLHALADALRPPVSPGDRVQLQIVREGREAGQGIGYLPDGTMVVVERAAEDVGETVPADVTSIMQSRQGRMLFAQRAEDDPGDGPA